MHTLVRLPLTGLGVDRAAVDHPRPQRHRLLRMGLVRIQPRMHRRPASQRQARRHLWPPGGPPRLHNHLRSRLRRHRRRPVHEHAHRWQEYVPVSASRSRLLSSDRAALAAIQGVGSGAIQVLTAIVTADLIPLKDRGFFQSLTGAYVSTFPAAASPPDIAHAVHSVLHQRQLGSLSSNGLRSTTLDSTGAHAKSAAAASTASTA